MAETTTNLFDIYSDLFKDVNGFRPRMVLADRFISKTVAEQEAELDRLQAELEADLQDFERADGLRVWTVAERKAEQSAREAFVAKVTALGLDPAKFMHLA